LFKGINYKKESHTLTAIRDALLPKLLSGEIKVKDAEKFVEAITCK
jgi:type I restriction enzyme S subunit